jgi:hypothetical protein
MSGGLGLSAALEAIDPMQRAVIKIVDAARRARKGIAGVSSIDWKG